MDYVKTLVKFQKAGYTLHFLRIVSSLEKTFVDTCITSLTPLVLNFQLNYFSSFLIISFTNQFCESANLPFFVLFPKALNFGKTIVNLIRPL